MTVPPTNSSVQSEPSASLPEKKTSLSPEQEKTEKVADKAIPKEIRGQTSLANTEREVKILTDKSPGEETINRIGEQKILEVEPETNDFTADSFFDEAISEPNETPLPPKPEPSTPKPAGGQERIPLQEQFLQKIGSSREGEKSQTKSPFSMEDISKAAKVSERVETKSEQAKTVSEQAKTVSEQVETESAQTEEQLEDVETHLRNEYKDFKIGAKGAGISDQEIDSLFQRVTTAIDAVKKTDNIEETLEPILKELKQKLSPKAYAFLLSFIKKELFYQLHYIEKRQERKIEPLVMYKEQKTQPSLKERQIQVKESTKREELALRAEKQKIEQRKEKQREETLQEIARTKKAQEGREELLKMKTRLEHALIIAEKEINNIELKEEERRKEEGKE